MVGSICAVGHEIGQGCEMMTSDCRLHSLGIINITLF